MYYGVNSNLLKCTYWSPNSQCLRLQLLHGANGFKEVIKVMVEMNQDARVSLMWQEMWTQTCMVTEGRPQDDTPRRRPQEEFKQETNQAEPGFDFLPLELW